MQTRGMTLIEVIVSSAIIGTVLMATTQVMLASRDALEVSAVEADLAAQAITILDRIANELKDARSTTVTTTGNPATAISFQKCDGFGTTSMLLTTPISYTTYTDPTSGKILCRRVQDGNAADLCDSLSGFGLVFTGRIGDPANAPPGSMPDVWELQIQLSRNTYSVVRKTTVQMKF